ncbi:hypothetical protein SteCoe_15921 [Stentor coeruleus]|uniref:Uncharacterized protein n=1 Tax=Stentor coeruleus TaxID=5963 RepID=A0A1R2C2I4_9CILI|nr:hypothetical protein SteCoe_15921 [Stentor coeruleus]
MADYDDIASKLIKYSELAKDHFIKNINELFSKPEFKSLIESISLSEQDIKLPFKRRANEILETKEEKKEPKKELKKEEKKETKTQKEAKESKEILNSKEIKKPKKSKDNKDTKKEKPQKDAKKAKSNTKNVKLVKEPKKNEVLKKPLEKEIKKEDKDKKNKTEIVKKKKEISSSDSDIFSGTDTESEIENLVKSGSENESNIEFQSESALGSESEKEYNSNAFISNMRKNKEGSIKQTDYWKMQEEEIREVFSSDSHSLFSSSPSSDTMDNNDLDTLISKLKSSPNLRKQVLIDINKIIDTYSLLSQKTKDKYKPLLLSLDSIKFSSEDSQSKSRLNEISAKVKKLFNSTSTEENFPLTEKFKTVLMKNDKNDIKIIIQRTIDAFPEVITSTTSKDMEQLIELIKKFIDSTEDGETKQQGKALIRKLTESLSTATTTMKFSSNSNELSNPYPNIILETTTRNPSKPLNQGKQSRHK